MESTNKFVSRTTDICENPKLAAGLLLGCTLLGLIVVIMAFWSQRSKFRVFRESIILIFMCQYSSLKGVQNIHDSMSALLFMDIINGVTAVVWAVHLILGTCSSACTIVSTVWFLSKSFGIILHLLCALLSVLHLCHPHCGVQLRSIATVVCVLTGVNIGLFYFLNLVGFIGLAAITFELALAIIGKSFGSTASPSAAASKGWIVFVAMFTFLIIYLPTFVLHCMRSRYRYNIGYSEIYENLLYGINFQLALDGILCLLILRLPAELEEEQQQPKYGTENPPPLTFQNPYYFN